MIDRRIKFRHVQCFVEIFQQGSFKAAAEALRLTQPAISRTMKELEEILGHTLLIRDRGGLRLTGAGETFLQFAQASIASLQQGIDSMTANSASGGGALSIGVLPSVAARLIPSVVDAFAAAFPAVVLRLWDGPQGFLIDRMKVGDIDFVIGRMGSDEQMKGVSFTLLYRERICFVVRRGHPLLERPVLEDLRNWPVIYPSAGSAIRPIIDRFLTENGIGTLPRRVETVSGAFGRVYVRNGDAVWIISEGVVANEIERGVLHPLPVNTDHTLGPIGIMAREDRDETAEARRFRRVIGDAVARGPSLTT